ncbi:hypothetical protein JHK85_045673 [Glycine max]|nr:hypothetical protein JHK85_045673 [Glycine max]KAH1150934.1 hypothetical protein GYH30_044770 [Glycine max]
MAHKTILLSFLVFLILQHNFGSMEASRKRINIHPPPAIPRSPQPPSVYWYIPNDDNVGGGDAYRPTSPGNSPGVGHETPPTK